MFMANYVLTVRTRKTDEGFLHETALAADSKLSQVQQAGVFRYNAELSRLHIGILTGEIDRNVLEYRSQKLLLENRKDE